MKSENKIMKPIYIVAATFLLAAMLSLFPKDLTVMGIELKQVDIFSDLKPVNNADENIIEEENSNDDFEYNGEMEIIEEDEENDTSEKVDHSLINHASLFGSISSFISEKSDKVEMRSNVNVKHQKITGYTKQLSHFFKALKNSRKQQVRVAHFGDSMIEGDLITSEIRQNLQKKFGGKGVGWVSVTSMDTKFRQTTTHTFSSGWKMYSIYTNNPKKMDLGISGEVFLPKSDSWMQYVANRRFRTTKNFDIARLFYSKSNGGSVKYSVDGASMKSAKLKKGSGIQEIVINKSRANKVKFEVPKNSGEYYGVSLESKTGVIVDNFPLRGNTGVDLKDINDSMLRNFSKHTKYDLIILEFGLNAIGAVKGNWSWYEREMIKVVKKFKKAFPKASILMISVHDKAKKKGSKFVTDPDVLKLLATQQKVVKKTKVAFWNMFEAMGGKNSMNEWVTANPPRAFKDYVHFNGQGAKKIAELLNEAILDAYNKN